MTREQDKTDEHFQTLIKMVGYNQDGCYNLDTNDPKVASELGKLVFDYLVCAIYDTCWEGFTSQDVQGVAHLLEDMVAYQKSL